MSNISQALAARALLGLSLPVQSPSPNVPISPSPSSPPSARSPSPVSPTSSLGSPNNSLLTLALAKVS